MVELTEDDCRKYDLGFIRTNFWSRLKIDEKVQSKLSEYMIQNIESNSDLVSNTSSTSHNATIGANILVTIQNDQTMITNDTIESTNDEDPDNDEHDDEEGGSIKPDELYLVGEIDAGIVVRPTLNESALSGAKGSFNNLIYNFWLQTKATNEEYNIRLVTIYLNYLLSDSVIDSFGCESAKDVIYRLNTVVHKSLVEEIMQCYTENLGEELKCKFMFMKYYKQLSRFKGFKPDYVARKLAEDFNNSLVNSTLSYFNDLNNMTKFEKDVYTDYNQSKKRLSTQMDYHIKVRSHLSIKFLYGLQCNDVSTQSMKSASDQFYFDNYTPRNQKFLTEMNNQIKKNKDKEVKLALLFCTWNSEEIESLIGPLTKINYDSDNEKNAKFQHTANPISRKVTRLIKNIIPPVDYVKIQNFSSSESRPRRRKKKAKDNYDPKAKKLRSDDSKHKTNAVHHSEKPNEIADSINSDKLEVFRVVKNFILRDDNEINHHNHLTKFINQHLCSSTSIKLYGIKLNKDLFASIIHEEMISSGMLNLYLEHLNFFLFLIHHYIKVPLSCVFFSTVFIKYLLENKELVSTWDDHFKFKDCKLIIFPIHLRDDVGEKSWSLVVCSIDKTNINIFMFFSKSVSISNERKGDMEKVISSWLKHKLIQSDLTIIAQEILIAAEMSSYKIIEIMTDIAFKQRCTESFDIDNGICRLIKDFRTDNQQWRQIQSRLIRVCCEIGTFNELRIFNKSNTPQYFKKSIEEMMSLRSNTYKNTAISFDDIVSDNTYFSDAEDNEEKDRYSEMQVFAKIKALEDGCLPKEHINCTLKSKIKFCCETYFGPVIDNDYVLSLRKRYNEGSDDDNDYDNDGNDTNLNNDGDDVDDDNDDDGSDFFLT